MLYTINIIPALKVLSKCILFFIILTKQIVISNIMLVYPDNFKNFV